VASIPMGPWARAELASKDPIARAKLSPRGLPLWTRNARSRWKTANRPQCVPGRGLKLARAKGSFIAVTKPKTTTGLRFAAASAFRETILYVSTIAAGPLSPAGGITSPGFAFTTFLHAGRSDGLFFSPAIETTRARCMERIRWITGTEVPWL